MHLHSLHFSYIPSLQVLWQWLGSQGEWWLTTGSLIHNYILNVLAYTLDVMMADMYNDSKHIATVLTSDLAALEGKSEGNWETGLHYRRQSTELALIQPIVLHSGGMHNVN